MNNIADLLQPFLNQTDSLNWSHWQPFPEPCISRGRWFTGHNYPGVYHIRVSTTHEHIIAGTGKLLSRRMRSLTPAPFGTGRRKNLRKREYVFNNWRKLEFRILKTTDETEALFIESILLGLFTNPK